MRYLIACSAAATILGAIYLIDWGAERAFTQKVRSLGGDPANADSFQIEVPARIQTLIVLDRFLFKYRFIWTALALMLFLAIAFYTRNSKRSFEN